MRVLVNPVIRYIGTTLLKIVLVPRKYYKNIFTVFIYYFIIVRIQSGQI